MILYLMYGLVFDLPPEISLIIYPALCSCVFFSTNIRHKLVVLYALFISDEMMYNSHDMCHATLAWLCNYIKLQHRVIELSQLALLKTKRKVSSFPTLQRVSIYPIMQYVRSILKQHQLLTEFFISVQ